MTGRLRPANQACPPLRQSPSAWGYSRPAPLDESGSAIPDVPLCARQLPRRAIARRKLGSGLPVAGDLPLLGVPVQLASQAQREMGQVHGGVLRQVIGEAAGALL